MLIEEKWGPWSLFGPFSYIKPLNVLKGVWQSFLDILIFSKNSR